MIEQQTDLIKEAATHIADRLGEEAHRARALIYRIVRAAGVDEARAFLQRAQEVEADGGMMLPDGSRRRTVGGVFFQIAKKGFTAQQRYAIWGYQNKKRPTKEPEKPKKLPKKVEKPRQPAPTFTWDDRIEAIQEAENERGNASTVKITIIGRPGKIVERLGCIVTIMEESKVPALPKGLPTPTSTPTKYAVYIASKQWNKVKEAIQDPEDVLIVEGYPKTDPQASAIAVFATNTTTKKLQQAQRK